MPISELLNSFRCAKRLRRPQARPPAVPKQHKDRTMSDGTDSGTSGVVIATPTSSQGDSQDLAPTIMDAADTQHMVTISILDQGMPRHYTRFCLGFRLGETPAADAISRLEAFFRQTFAVEPWLAGYACPAQEDSSPAGKLEIRYSQRDVEKFRIKVQELDEDKFPLTYDEFCDLGMPPSKIPRDLISSCPERRPDTAPALILDVTVNILRGGLLIALFLHHGVTDGATMGTIISGKLCAHVAPMIDVTPEFFAAAAARENATRAPLSIIPANQPLGNHTEYKAAFRAQSLIPPSPLGPTPPPSEVTSHIFLFRDSTLQRLKASLNHLVQSTPHPTIPWITTHDALQSLLWQHLTRARLPSLVASGTPLPTKSTLLIPVNIRKRISPPLALTYLGGAVALAPVTVSLSSLLPPPTDHDLQPEALARVVEKAYLLSTAIAIHTTIPRCNDDYLRQVLALTMQQDRVQNMTDLAADTASGLDLCITSWAVLPVFGDAATDPGAPGAESKEDSDDCGTLGMGLGLPDFVRKPWSRDAGGCIILPRDRRMGRGGHEAGLEVVVQLKKADMERLMQDEEFMACVGRVID